MQIIYLDGTEDNDRLFDEPVDYQRAYVARCMNLNPSAPDSWPIEAIDRLLGLRKYEGKRQFYREIGRMLTPNHC